MLNTQGNVANNFMLRSDKCLFKDAKLILGKPSSYVGEVVSPTYIKINSTRSAIFIIDICIDNRPFKVFINRKEEGVGDLECGDVGETNGL